MLLICLHIWFNTMHILVFCVFKKYIHLLVQNFTDLGNEKDFEEALRLVSQSAYRPKGLGQRWPISLNASGFFKTEEYTNFNLWYLSFISKKLQIERHFVLGSLGVLLTKLEFFFYKHAEALME